MELGRNILLSKETLARDKRRRRKLRMMILKPNQIRKARSMRCLRIGLPTLDARKKREPTS